jgi:DHA1 family multidrug resistance protein-like MFS transporter
MGMSMSLWAVFMTVGTMVGSIVGAYIAETWGFHSTFYVSSILSVVGVAITALYMRRYREQEEKPRIRVWDAMKTGFSGLLSDKSVRLLMIVSGVTFMARTVIWTFLPLYVSILIDMSTLEIGFLTALTNLVLLVASVIVGKLSEKYSNENLTLAGFLLAALFFFAYFFAESAMHVYLISIMLSICLSVSPLLTAMISELSPSEHMGMSMGILGSFEDIGAMLGPAIFGMVWAALSPKYIFLVSGVAQLIGAILIVLYKVRH